MNAGEEKVLAEFASRLHESVRIFPNVLMRLSRHQLVECDQIIITDDRIWLVDVKDLYGDVQFRRGEHVVDGERRSDPIKNAKLRR